jgi:hypothetical protein
MNSHNVAGDTSRWRGLIRISWWMLPAFAAWTAVYIFASEPILRTVFGFAPSAPGETLYIEEWGPWIAVTISWLLPILIGMVASALALRRGAGKQAWVSLLIHLALFLFLTLPNIIERLLFL